MAHRWDLRSPEPHGLVWPVPLDPTGAEGPTRGQARGPRWRRTGHNLYVPAHVAPDRVEQRIVEAAARLPAGGLISGWAALRLHGVNFCDGLDRDLAELPVPVVLPLDANMRPGGVERHRSAVPPAERTVCFGVPCTSPARALFDAMVWSGDLREAVVVADSMFAARVLAREDFAAYVGSRAGAKGYRLVDEALPLTVDRSRSPMESRMRLVWVLDAGLPWPRCNWPVADLAGNRIGRPDLLCEEVAVVGEFDGRDHSGARRRSDDARKDQAYRDVGLESFRIVGREIDDVALVVRRMQAAVRRAAEAERPALWLIREQPGPL
jgi:hypothetical protein